MHYKETPQMVNHGVYSATTEALLCMLVVKSFLPVELKKIE